MEKTKEKNGKYRNCIMKKLIIFISIICLIAVLFCGCGEKNNKDKTEPQISMTQGVDEVAVDELEGNTVVEDFETGSIISVPSSKDNSSSSSGEEEIVDTPSSSSSSSASSGSSSSSSGVSSVESGVDENLDTMEGYNPWH